MDLKILYINGFPNKKETVKTFFNLLKNNKLSLIFS
jgi:hypothetical protein